MKTLLFNAVILSLSSIPSAVYNSFNSFAINWPLIWTDLSFPMCLCMFFLTVSALIAYRIMVSSIREHYLVKTTSKLVHLHGLIDEKEREYKFLNEAFAEYRTDAQNEAFERQERINRLEIKCIALNAELIETQKQHKQCEIDKFELQDNIATLRAENVTLRTQLQGRRNPDGTFKETTGKGHGKHKTKPASASSKFAEPAAPTEQTPDRDWTTATPEELLAEAKRKYPVGTKVKNNGLCDSCQENDVFKCNPIIQGDKIWLSGATEQVGYSICVYKNGQWAEILS